MKRARAKLQPQAEAPQPVRRAAREGAAAVMRADWLDPDDFHRSAARTTRSIHGYRTYCPLRRMMRQPGSQVTEFHVYAADRLRIAIDVAALGLSAVRSLMATPAQAYPFPRQGPSLRAVKQVTAWREAVRCLNRCTASQRLLLTSVVLLNHSLQRWCIDSGAKNQQIEMGRLLSVLDLLAEHYATEIEDDLRNGRMIAAV